MTSNILPFFAEGFVHDEPVEQFLDTVKPLNLVECIVIGHDEEGKLFVGGNISEFDRLVFLLFRGEAELKRIEKTLPTYGFDDE